jgi:coiled-coil domain-containing protein 12
MQIVEERKNKLKVLLFFHFYLHRNSYILKELRSKATPGNKADSVLQVVFRNYQPYDRQLTHSQPTCQDNTSEIIESTKSQNAILNELSNAVATEADLIPKKINWDLKLQTVDRMDKLKRRTQRSVIELLREKLVNEVTYGDN